MQYVPYDRNINLLSLQTQELSLLDKMSVGKGRKWGMAKNSPAVLLTIVESQQGLLGRYLFTIQWHLIYLEPQNWMTNTPSEVSESEIHWLFWRPLHAYCVLNLSSSTHCCAVTCHKQMALCITLWTTSNLKTKPLLLLSESPRIFWIVFCFGLPEELSSGRFILMSYLNEARVLGFRTVSPHSSGRWRSDENKTFNLRINRLLIKLP